MGKRFEKLPELIRTRQGEEVKSTVTLQVGSLRSDIEYITAGGPPFYRNNDQSTPAFKKANAFFQDLADLLVAAKAKNFPKAQTYYDSAMVKFGEWKQLVSFRDLLRCVGQPQRLPRRVFFVVTGCTPSWFFPRAIGLHSGACSISGEAQQGRKK